jgi:hypothetical protein
MHTTCLLCNLAYVLNVNGRYVRNSICTKYRWVCFMGRFMSVRICHLECIRACLGILRADQCARVHTLHTHVRVWDCLCAYKYAHIYIYIYIYTYAHTCVKYAKTVRVLMCTYLYFYADVCNPMQNGLCAGVRAIWPGHADVNVYMHTYKEYMHIWRYTKCMYVNIRLYDVVMICGF